VAADRGRVQHPCLGIDNAIADQRGRMSGVGPIDSRDGLFAATAATNGLTLVTRNDRDFIGLGAMVLIPFRGGEDYRT
jgi:toxin FitB